MIRLLLTVFDALVCIALLLARLGRALSGGVFDEGTPMFGRVFGHTEHAPESNKYRQEEGAA